MSLQLLPIVPQLLKASARRTATWSASLRSLRRTTSAGTTFTRLDAGSSTRRYSSPTLSSSLRPAVALSAVGAKGRRSFEQQFSSSSVHGTSFRLADIGEGITECEVVKWLVEEGQMVEEFDPIVEVMSDKATVEITSPYSGRITNLGGGVGDVIRVGAVLCEVDREGEGAATGVPTAEETGVVSRLEEMVIELEEAAEVQAKGGKGTIATPATRRVAREHSVDLKDVAGSGRDGRVSKSDVLAHVAALSRTTTIETTKVTTNVVSSPTSSPVTTPATTTTTIPLTPLRKAMFRAMSATLQIPHFSYSETIDITLLERLRLRLNSFIPTQYLKTHSPSQLASMKRMREDWNVGEQVEDTRRYDRMTLLPLFIKALSVAMDQHPLFSCSLTPESTLLHRPTHDISIALSAPDGGLFTPLLQNVQASSPFHLASHIAHLQSLSTASSPPKFGTEYAGNGTITLSNVGVVGGRFTAPIIPPTGQLAIGAMGRSRIESRYLDSKGAREVAIHGGDGEGLKRVPRLVMDVTFSADHRVVEGVELAKLVESWKRIIEAPDVLVGLGR